MIHSFNVVSLLVGRVVVGTVLLIFFIALSVFLRWYFFRAPYCPYCRSRRTVELLAGNIADGLRCGNKKCGQYYWRGPSGQWWRKRKSFKKNPHSICEMIEARNKRFGS